MEIKNFMSSNNIESQENNPDLADWIRKGNSLRAQYLLILLINGNFMVQYAYNNFHKDEILRELKINADKLQEIKLQ